MDARTYGRMPVFWLALFVLAGFFSPITTFHEANWLVYIALVVCILGLLLGLRRAVFGLVGGFMVGMLLHWHVQESTPELPLPQTSAQVYLQVVQDARPTPYGRYFLAVTDSASSQGVRQAIQLHLLVYIPDQGESPKLGERAVVSGRLKPLTSIRNEGYRNYLVRQGIQAVLQGDSLQPSGPAGGLYGLRAYLSKRIEMQFDSSTAGLLQALLVGDRGGISPATRADFVQSGTAHLLAISGQHISVLLVVFSFLVGLQRGQGGGYVLRMVLIIMLLAMYVPLAGGSPSVVRAVVMVIGALVANRLQRTPVALNLLGISILAQMMWHPRVAYDLSFQLSHAAVAGILLYLPALDRPLQRLPKALQLVIMLLAVSLVAQVATLPFQLSVFGQLPTYALVVNLVAVPLSALLLVAGWAWMALSWVPVLADALIWFASLLAKILLWLTGYAADLPGAVLTFQVVPAWVGIPIGLMLLGLGLMLSLRRGAKGAWWLLA